MWSTRGAGGKELTIIICAVFSKQNFPNQNKEDNRWYLILTRDGRRVLEEWATMDNDSSVPT